GFIAPGFSLAHAPLPSAHRRHSSATLRNPRLSSSTPARKQLTSPGVAPPGAAKPQGVQPLGLNSPCAIKAVVGQSGADGHFSLALGERDVILNSCQSAGIHPTRPTRRIP